MQPNLTDVNDAMLGLMVQSAKQSDRIKALEAELAALKDPWTYIKEGRPETLPAHMGLFLLSITDDGYDEATLPGYRGDVPGEFYSWTGEKLAPGTVYAHQPLPDPAPYPEE